MPRILLLILFIRTGGFQKCSFLTWFLAKKHLYILTHYYSQSLCRKKNGFLVQFKGKVDLIRSSKDICLKWAKPHTTNHDRLCLRVLKYPSPPDHAFQVFFSFISKSLLSSSEILPDSLQWKH